MANLARTLTRNDWWIDSSIFVERFFYIRPDWFSNWKHSAEKCNGHERPDCQRAAVSRALHLQLKVLTSKAVIMEDADLCWANIWSSAFTNKTSRPNQKHTFWQAPILLTCQVENIEAWLTWRLSSFFCSSRHRLQQYLSSFKRANANAIVDKEIRTFPPPDFSPGWIALYKLK